MSWQAKDKTKLIKNKYRKEGLLYVYTEVIGIGREVEGKSMYNGHNGFSIVEDSYRNNVFSTNLESYLTPSPAHHTVTPLSKQFIHPLNVSDTRT